jgi:hypothetical protein
MSYSFLIFGVFGLFCEVAAIGDDGSSAVQQIRGHLFGRHPAAIARVFAQHQIAQQLQVFISPVVPQQQQQPQPKQQSGWAPFSIFLFSFLICYWPVSFLANAPVSLSLFILFLFFLLMDRVVFFHPCVRLHVHCTCSRKLQQDWPVLGQKRPEEAPSCFIFRPAEAAAAARTTSSDLASLSSPVSRRRVRPASVCGSLTFRIYKHLCCFLAMEMRLIF